MDIPYWLVMVVCVCLALVAGLFIYAVFTIMDFIMGPEEDDDA